MVVVVVVVLVLVLVVVVVVVVVVVIITGAHVVGFLLVPSVLINREQTNHVMCHWLVISITLVLCMLQVACDKCTNYQAYLAYLKKEDRVCVDCSVHLKQKQNPDPREG